MMIWVLSFQHHTHVTLNFTKKVTAIMSDIVITYVYTAVGAVGRFYNALLCVGLQENHILSFSVH